LVYYFLIFDKYSWRYEFQS